MALTDRNGMIVRIAANLDELKKSLAEGTTAITTTTGAMQKLAAGLDGSKLEQRAHNIVAAINEIGGATKLTDAEATRHLKTLDSWVEKADLLGKRVPTDLLTMRDRLRAIADESEKLPAKTIDWKNALTSVAGVMGVTFSVGAVVSFGKHVFDTASNIHDMAEKLGISTDAVQGFKFAAEQSGSSLDAVGTAINKMNSNLDGGSKSTVAALKEAGLNFQTIRAMKPEDAFLAISDAIQRIPDPMEQSHVALELFGKSASELLPGIKEGFRAAAAAADKMSKDTIDTLESGQDAWERLGNKITIITGSIISHTMDATSRITSSWKEVGVFVDNVTKLGFAQALAMADLTEKASRTKAQDVNLPAPAAVHKTAEELAAAGAAAKKAAEEAARYAAVVAEIHAATVPLTAVQKEQVRTLEALGVSTGTIAKYLHLTDAPIVKFNEQLKETARSIAEIGKQVNQIPHNVPLLLQSQNLSSAAPLIDVEAVRQNGTAWKQIADATFNDIEGRMRANGIFTQEQLEKNAAKAREQFESMRNSGLFTSQELQEAWARMVAANDAATSGWAASFHSALESLPGLLVSAFTGGGGIGGALKGWASSIGSDFGKELFGPKGLLSGIGAMIPGIGPAIGSLLGPVLGKIGGMFKDLFGLGTAGRSAVTDFASSMGGFDALHEQLGELGDEGERLWVTLTQGVGRNDPKAAQAAIDAVTAALQKHKDALDSAASSATAAGTAESDAMKQAQAAVDEITGKIQSLQDSIKDEAPEEVMGVVEANTRAQIDALAKQRDAAQSAIDDTTTAAAAAAQQAGDIIDTALADREFQIRVKVNLDGLPDGMSVATHGDGGFYDAPHFGIVGDRPEYITPRDSIGALAREIAAAGGAGNKGGGYVPVTIQIAGGRPLWEGLIEVARAEGLT